MYESQIKFRYLAGTSAGGRTTLGEMQRYPEDYNWYFVNGRVLLGHFIYWIKVGLYSLWIMKITLFPN